MNGLIEYYNEVVLYKKGGGTTLLLDEFPNASIAFDLRLLNSNYNGYCVKIRRSSDNAILDISFTNGIIDVDTISSFCGSGNGYIDTWYDQSGNGNNLTQSTTTKQPFIYESGSLITQLGKPSIKFQVGAEMNFNTMLNYGSSDWSLFIPYLPPNNSTAILYRDFGRYLWLDYSSNQYIGNTTIGYNFLGSSYIIVTIIGKLSADSYIYENKTYSIHGNPQTISEAILFSSATYRSEIMHFNSFVIYAFDNTTNKDGINDNINTYYSIY